MANIIDIIVNGKDNASRVLERVGQTAERAFERAQRASTQLTTKMKEIGSRGRELGENMVDMSENLMQGLTLPLALIGGVAIKSAGDIDRMFSILQAQTGNSEAAMKRLTPIVQQVFRDGLGKDLNEIATIAGQAQQKLKGLNDAQLSDVINNVAALSSILGVDASGAIDEAKKMMDKFKITSDQAMDLVAGGVKTADLNSKNLAKTLRQVKGRAGEVTAIAQGDTWVKFTSMWRQIQEALKPVGDELSKLALDYLPKVISSIEGFSKWFTSLSDRGKLATVAIAGFVAVLPVLLMSLGALIMLGSSIIGFFGTIGGALAAVTAPTWGWIAGIAALAAVLVLAWNKSATFRAIVLQAWDAIKVGFQAVVSYLTPAVQAVVAFVLQQWTKIKTWWDANGPTILQAIRVVWDAIKPIIQYAMNTIVPIIKLGWELISNTIKTAWEIIKVVVSNGINIVLNVISLFANLLTGRWGAAWQNVKNIASSAWNLIKGVVSAAIHGVLNNISSVLSAITSKFSSAWNSIKSTASSVWGKIKTAITSPIESAKKTVLGIIDDIKGAFNKLKISIPKPHIPIPSFSFSKGDILNGVMPSFGVSWHAKGGLFNGPSIIGVGEKTKEAVIPLSGPNMRPFAQAIAKEMGNGDGGNITNNINIYPRQAVLKPQQLARELDRVRWLNGGRMA